MPRRSLFLAVVFAIQASTSAPSSAGTIAVEFELEGNLNIGSFPLGAVGAGKATLAFTAVGPSTIAPGFVHAVSFSLMHSVDFPFAPPLRVTGYALFSGMSWNGSAPAGIGGGLSFMGSFANGVNVASTLHCSRYAVFNPSRTCTNDFGLASVTHDAMSATGLKVNLEDGAVGTQSGLVTFALFGPEFGSLNNGEKNPQPLFFSGPTPYGSFFFLLTGTEVGRTFVPEPRSSFLLGLGLLGLAGAASRIRRCSRSGGKGSKVGREDLIAAEGWTCGFEAKGGGGRKADPPIGGSKMDYFPAGR